MTTLSAIVGDITRIEVDAIVNAAKSSLAGGGGVDGAIHRAAGPELVAACLPLAPCPTGEARATPGFLLPAKWVIHTVGPVWQGGTAGEAELLAACYRNSLEAAASVGARSVVFPGISTGIYGYPVEQATQTAIKTINAFIAERTEAFESVSLIWLTEAEAQAAAAVIADAQSRYTSRRGENGQISTL